MDINLDEPYIPAYKRCKMTEENMLGLGGYYSDADISKIGFFRYRRF